MARIPDGSGFGNAGPVRPQGGGARDPGSEDMQALGRVAATIGGIAQDAQRKQASDDDALARAKASNALLDHELAVKARADDVAGRVSTGEIQYQDADALYQAEVDKIPAPDFTQLDPVLAEQVKGGLTRNAVSGRGIVSQVTGQAKRADFRSQFSQALDTLGKLGAAPDADIDAINAKARAFKALALQAEIPPDQIDKALQDFSDKNWTNHATRRYIAGREDAAALAQLETDLTADDGYYATRLDTDKRNALLSQVMGGRTRLDARAQVEADKREAVAEREVTWFRDQLVTGQEIAGARWQEGMANVQGTTQEGAFKEAQAMAAEVQEFRSRPFAEQEAYVRALESQTKTSPSMDPKRDLSRLNTLRSTFDAARKSAQEEPLTFLANQTGVQTPPLALDSLRTGDPSVIAAQLQSRFATLASIRKSYGPDVGLNPWLPEETAIVKEFFAKADDKGRLNLLSVLSSATPDAASYAGALKPIAAEEPLFMAAGMAQFRKLKGADGTRVPELILSGARVLSDKTTVMPTDAEFVRVFDERVGTALPAGSAERQAAFNVFRALYAGRAMSTSNLHTEYQGKVYAKDELVEDAIAMGLGEIATVGGEKVIAPHGMSLDDFETRLQGELGRASRASGFDLDAMEDMPLMPAPGEPEGSYYLVNGGSIQTDPKTRKPIIVRVQ